MAAHTEQGKAVRELYRQAKAKWDLTKQIAPQVANEVEMMHMRIILKDYIKRYPSLKTPPLLPLPNLARLLRG
jgi:hypothetical protein